MISFSEEYHCPRIFEHRNENLSLAFLALTLLYLALHLYTGNNYVNFLNEKFCSYFKNRFKNFIFTYKFDTFFCHIPDFSCNFAYLVSFDNVIAYKICFKFLMIVIENLHFLQFIELF